MNVNYGGVESDSEDEDDFNYILVYSSKKCKHSKKLIQLMKQLNIDPKIQITPSKCSQLHPSAPVPLRRMGYRCDAPNTPISATGCKVISITTGALLSRKSGISLS